MSNQKKIHKRIMHHWPLWMPLPRHLGLSVLIGLGTATAISAPNPAISLLLLAATIGAAWLVATSPDERE